MFVGVSEPSLMQSESSPTGYLESDTAKDYGNEKQGTVGELIILEIRKHGKYILFKMYYSTVTLSCMLFDHCTDKQ